MVFKFSTRVIGRVEGQNACHGYLCSFSGLSGYNLWPKNGKFTHIIPHLKFDPPFKISPFHKNTSITILPPLVKIAISQCVTNRLHMQFSSYKKFSVGPKIKSQSADQYKKDTPIRRPLKNRKDNYRPITPMGHLANRAINRPPKVIPMAYAGPIEL